MNLDHLALTPAGTLFVQNGSKPGRSDVLIALRMLVDVVCDCLWCMTSERLNGVADDGHLTGGDGDIRAHPGLQLPI